MRQVLEEQRKLMANFNSPYVFFKHGGEANPPRQAQGIVEKGHGEKRGALLAYVRDPAYLCLLGIGER
jgi:hypothetical protein